MYTYDVDGNFSGISGTCLLFLALPLLCKYYWQVFWCSLVPSCNYDAKKFHTAKQTWILQCISTRERHICFSDCKRQWPPVCQNSGTRDQNPSHRQGHAVISRAMWIYWTFRGLMECHKFEKCLVKGECLCIACWSVSLPWARRMKACS